MDSDNDVDSTSQESTFDFIVSSHPENIEYESSSKEDDRSENTCESFDTEKESHYSVEDDYRVKKYFWVISLSQIITRSLQATVVGVYR